MLRLRLLHPAGLQGGEALGIVRLKLTDVPRLRCFRHSQRRAVHVPFEVTTQGANLKLVTVTILGHYFTANTAQFLYKHRLFSVPSIEQPQHAACKRFLLIGAEAIPKLPVALRPDLRRTQIRPRCLGCLLLLPPRIYGLHRCRLFLRKLG